MLFTPGRRGSRREESDQDYPDSFSTLRILLRLGWLTALPDPGGNVTGFSSIAPVLAGKRWSCSRKLSLGFHALRYCGIHGSRASHNQWKESQLAARELGVKLHSTEVSNADRFDSAFQEAIKAAASALAVIATPLVNTNQKRIADLATITGCRRSTLRKILSTAAV